MLRPMEIPVGVSQIERANRAMADLARNTRAVGTASRGIGFGGGGFGGRAGGLAPPRAPVGSGDLSLTGGPNYRLAMAQARLAGMRAIGAPRQAIQDAQGAVLRAHAAVQRQQQALSGGPSQQQRIATAILSSRFGAGGLQPLVGRTLAASGITGAAAAPVAIAIGAIGLAARALEEFARFVSDASERIHQFGIAATVSGGTGANIAALRGMGVDPGEVGGASSALRGRLVNDPLARATAAQLGVGPVLPQSVGSQNNAQILQRTLQGLRDITARLPSTASATERAAAAEEQLRKARLLGLEAYVDQLRVSERVWRRSQEIADTQRRINDAGTTQAARDLAGEQRNRDAARQNLRDAVAKFFIPSEASAARYEARITNDAAKGKLFPGVPQVQRDARGKIIHNTDPWGRPILPKDNAPADPQTTAQQRNTAALDNVAAELSRLNQNLGGGPRSSIIPPGYFSGAAGLYGNGDFKGAAQREREELRRHADELGPFAG